MWYETKIWQQYGTKIYVDEGNDDKDILGVIHNPGNCRRVVDCVNFCTGIPSKYIINQLRNKGEDSLGKRLFTIHRLNVLINELRSDLP